MNEQRANKRFPPWQGAAEGVTFLSCRKRAFVFSKHSPLETAIGDNGRDVGKDAGTVRAGSTNATLLPRQSNEWKEVTRRELGKNNKTNNL